MEVPPGRPPRAYEQAIRRSGPLLVRVCAYMNKNENTRAPCVCLGEIALRRR